jgi:polyisoprenoid-binding protein YceI
MKSIILTLLLCLSTSIFATPIQIDKNESNVFALVQASPPHSFECHPTSYEMQLDVNKETGNLESADYSFSFDHLDTDNKSRNKKMRKWEESEKYPRCTFHLTEVKNSNGNKVGVGDFELHGVKKQIEIPFTETLDENGHYVLRGTSTINYTDFNLPIIRLLILSVNPEVKIYINVEGDLNQK